MKCLYLIADYPVYRFILPAIRSNMYLLICRKEALVIDPHASTEADRLLAKAGVRRCTILLTHEHLDHTSGVNHFRKRFDCRVICTDICGELIREPKKSGAAFFPALFLNKEQQKTEDMYWLNTNYSCWADETYSDRMEETWCGIHLSFREMAGHSRGGQIICADESSFFTGDNLVPGEKIITRLPGGDKRRYEAETLPFLRALPKENVIFPGHGEPALLADCLSIPPLA